MRQECREKIPQFFTISLTAGEFITLQTNVHVSLQMSMFNGRKFNGSSLEVHEGSGACALLRAPHPRWESTVCVHLLSFGYPGKVPLLPPFPFFKMIKSALPHGKKLHSLSVTTFSIPSYCEKKIMRIDIGENAWPWNHLPSLSTMALSNKFLVSTGFKMFRKEGVKVVIARKLWWCSCGSF